MRAEIDPTIGANRGEKQSLRRFGTAILTRPKVHKVLVPGPQMVPSTSIAGEESIKPVYNPTFVSIRAYA
jgi:hypothetical protein